MAKQYSSIKIILDRLLRNPLLAGLSFESVIDYTLDFISIIGIPSIYEDKLYESKIENYRAALPCDFIEENQVLITDNNRRSVTIPARYATDTMHNHYNAIDINTSADYTFTINNNFIFTSVENGKLQMGYKAIMTDEEGYPLLPSESSFLKALEWYIKVEYYTLLWENGRIADKTLQHSEQEYSWAVGRVESDMMRLSLAKAESFFNSFRTLIPRDTEFQKRFANNGAKEYIKRH